MKQWLGVAIYEIDSFTFYTSSHLNLAITPNVDTCDVTGRERDGSEASSPSGRRGRFRAGGSQAAAPPEYILSSQE